MEADVTGFIVWWVHDSFTVHNYMIVRTEELMLLVKVAVYESLREQN